MDHCKRGTVTIRVMTTAGITRSSATRAREPRLAPAGLCGAPMTLLSRMGWGRRRVIVAVADAATAAGWSEGVVGRGSRGPVLIAMPLSYYWWL